KRHLMEPLFMERGAPLYRSAKPMLLGPIEPKVFAAFLRDRFEAGGVAIGEVELDRILELSGGLPYEAQELCSYVWTEAKLAAVPVDEALIDRALHTLVDAEGARCAASPAAGARARGRPRVQRGLPPPAQAGLRVERPTCALRAREARFGRLERGRGSGPRRRLHARLARPGGLRPPAEQSWTAARVTRGAARRPARRRRSGSGRHESG